MRSGGKAALFQKKEDALQDQKSRISSSAMIL